MTKLAIGYILASFCYSNNIDGNPANENQSQNVQSFNSIIKANSIPKIIEELKTIPQTFFNYVEWEYEISQEKTNISEDYIWLKSTQMHDSTYLNACILDSQTLAISEFWIYNTHQDGCMDCVYLLSKIIILKKTGQGWESISSDVLPKEFSEYILKVFENPVLQKDGYLWLANEDFGSHAPFVHIRDKKLTVRDISVLDNSYGTVIEMEWINDKFEIKSRKKLPLKPKLDKITNNEFRDFLSGFRYILLPETFCVSRYYLNESLKTIPEKYYSLIDFKRLNEYKGIYWKVKFDESAKAEYIGIIKISEQFVALIFRTVEANNYPDKKSIVLATFKPDGTFINSIILTKGGDENIGSTIDKTLKIRQEMHSPGEGSTEYGHRTYIIEKCGLIKMLSNKNETDQW
jgi:hypothetical protein